MTGASTTTILLGLLAIGAHGFCPGGFLPQLGSTRSCQARSARSSFGLRSSQGRSRIPRLSALMTNELQSSRTDIGGPYLGHEHLVGERDACGVGFIADTTGKQGPRGVLDKALVALGCMEHRGACSADSVSQYQKATPIMVMSS